MDNLYADRRWIGDHGLGRMARELLHRLECKELPIRGNPASPIDPIRMSVCIMKLPTDSVVLTPGYNVPVLLSRDYVLTIADLNHVERHENSNALKRLYFNVLVKRACRRARVIITISEFSKSRVVKWAGVSAKKVVNIGCGVSEIFYSPDIVAWSPGYQYFLCVGNRKKHKNEEGAIRGFQRARIERGVKLVLTGERSKDLDAVIEELGLAERMVFLGRVSDAALAALYRGARALIFPSFYEGFGLPVAEAMACGTPVISSNTSSLPEVGKDAVVYVNPSSITEIAHAIEVVYEKTVDVEALVKRGKEYSKAYKWGAVHKKLEKALHDSE